MEINCVAERCGNYVQIFDTVQNKVVKRLPYSRDNFSALIKEVKLLGRKEFERITGKKIPVKRIIKKLPKASNLSKLDKGVITMDYNIPTPLDVAGQIGGHKAYGKIDMSFKPTEKTLVKLNFPHGEYKSSKGVVLLKASRRYSIDFFELQGKENKKISTDYYKSMCDATDAFSKQIEFCVKMYGRVQPVVCEWC